MATAQRARPRAVVVAPRRAAWQPKSCITKQRQRSAVYNNFLHFFTFNANGLFLYVQQWLVMI